jgi:hypothetical protein
MQGKQKILFRENLTVNPDAVRPASAGRAGRVNERVGDSDHAVRVVWGYKQSGSASYLLPAFISILSA